MDGEGKLFYFGSTQGTAKEDKSTRQRKRSPGKMARNRDLTAARRQEENLIIAEFTDVLPLSKEELKKADRTALIRLALHFIKMKTIPGLSLDDGKKMSSSLSSSITVPGFSGFVLLVDDDFNIMYSSDNITKQLGPLLVDTIGQQLDELIHPDDYSTATESLLSVFADNQASNKKVNFVAGMKTTLSSSIRSATKIQYKNVFVTCYLKTFGQSPECSKSLAVLLCRSEDIKGLPEICYGAYVESYTDMQCKFLRIDVRGEWIFGYGATSLIGKDAKVLRHPGDDLDMHVLVERKELIFCKGNFVSPAYRVVSAWGDWLWVRSSFEPRIGPKGEWRGFKVRTWIVGTGEVVTNALHSAIATKSISAPTSTPPGSTPRHTSAASSQHISQSSSPPQQSQSSNMSAQDSTMNARATGGRISLMEKGAIVPEVDSHLSSVRPPLAPPPRLRTSQAEPLCCAKGPPIRVPSATSSEYSSPGCFPQSSPPLGSGSGFLHTGMTDTTTSNDLSLSGPRDSGRTLSDDAIDDFLRDIIGDAIDSHSEYSKQNSPQSLTLTVFSPQSISSDHSNQSYGLTPPHRHQPGAHDPQSNESYVSYGSLSEQPSRKTHSPGHTFNMVGTPSHTQHRADVFGTQRFAAAEPQSKAYLPCSTVFNSVLPSHSQMAFTANEASRMIYTINNTTEPCQRPGIPFSVRRDLPRRGDGQHPIVL